APASAVTQLRTKTTTERAGTVNVPVALSKVAPARAGSAEPTSAGCRVTPDAPAKPGTTCVCAVGVALNTTVMDFQCLSSRPPGPLSESTMVITPGFSADVPDSGNDSRACTCAAVPSENSGEDCLTLSSSW